MNFPGFLSNIGLLLALAVVLQMVMRRVGPSTIRYCLISGLLFGIIGIVSMLQPVQFAPGIIFDGRTIILSVAGFSGGPVTATVAAVLCGAYRLYLGGPGAIIGVCTIIDGAAIGSVFYVLRRRDQRFARLLPLWGFGYAVHIVMLALMMGLPGGAGPEVLRAIAVPVLTLYPFAVMLLCRLFVDYEEKIKNQAALRENEKKYWTLFENMSQGAFYQRADGALTDVNTAALELLGLSREEFLGRTSHNPAWKVILEDGSPLPPAEQPSMAAMKSGSAVRDAVVGVFNSRTGVYVWLAINAIPQYHAGQAKPFQVFVTMHDITLFRQTQDMLQNREQEVLRLLDDARQARRVLLNILEDDRLSQLSLRESEERFKAVVETAIDAIITVDSRGLVVLWNRAAEAIFGYSVQEITGRQFSTLLPEAVRETHINTVRKTIETGVIAYPSKSFEVPCLRKDGSEFPAEIALGIVKKQDEVLITAIVRDISQRKLIEQEAMRSAQLASIGELAAGVAHEINNPIMGVINYAQIIFNTTGPGAPIGEIAARIMKEGERIAAIVSNLLVFARPAAEKPAAVSVQSILEPSFHLMQKLFEKSAIVTEFRLPDTLPRVLVQPQKIQQVFVNMLSNALYALNERFPGFHEDKKFAVYAEEIRAAEGHFLRVTFHDNGCGIEKQHFEKICSPFFTTKPSGMGTGLGLSICHNIIREHGGRLQFESRIGEFTKVSVDLPAEE